MTKEDLILVEYLKTNGIEYIFAKDKILIQNTSAKYTSLFYIGEAHTSDCAKDLLIADPNFIVNLKERIKMCSDIICDVCPRNPRNRCKTT